MMPIWTEEKYMKCKQIVQLALALCLLVVFSACGAGDWQNQSSSGTTAESEENSSSSQAEISQDDYADSLDGLCEYLTDSGIISGDPTEMEAQLIGAEAGKMYVHAFEGGQVTVELYGYDSENLNDVAKSTVNSVKQNGTFTLLGTETAAILSDNGKYLMIYKDIKSEEVNVAQKERAEKLFREFKK